MKQWLTYLICLSFVFSCSDELKETTNTLLTLNSDVFKIEFEYRDYENSYRTSANDTDNAKVKIHYPHLLSGSDAIVQINNAIMSELLDGFDEEINFNSFDEIADSLFTQYRSVHEEFSDYHTAWFIHKKIIFSGILANYISIKSETTMYTGGANSYYNIDLSIFDLYSGRKQSLSDFVFEDKMLNFLKIGELNFRKIKNIPINQSIKETGYWFENDKFYLPDNFNITDSGFTFIYNLYEIAPRSEGYTRLFIPKEELKDIIDPNKIFK